jgi:glycosyltransferase involved in cell wall biosynthesis
MRITYVIPYFAPAWGYGGPPRVAFDMARHLVARGHQVDVLTTDAFDAKHRLERSEETMDGVLIHRDRNLNNRWASQFKVFLPFGFEHTFREHVLKSDVIHLFDFRTFQNAVAVQWLRRSGAPPYVLSAFGELPRATGVKRPIKAVYDLVFGFRLLRDAARVLAQTPQEADEYHRFGCPLEQIRQLPLAVSLDELASAPPPGCYRAQLGISPTERVILFLGRIHEYKGLDLLIRAFAEISPSRSDVRLVIAGRDDGFLAAARALAARLTEPGRVLFPGPIYGADRFGAYHDADVFAITPTHAEQTSLAALEACAVGTPVLVTEQAPIPGLEAAQAGLSVPAQLPAVASALTNLLDRHDRSEMGSRARALVRDHFSWTTVTGVLESIYAEVVTPNSGAPTHAA